MEKGPHQGIQFLRQCVKKTDLYQLILIYVKLFMISDIY